MLRSIPASPSGRPRLGAQQPRREGARDEGDEANELEGGERAPDGTQPEASRSDGGERAEEDGDIHRVRPRQEAELLRACQRVPAVPSV